MGYHYLPPLKSLTFVRVDQITVHRITILRRCIHSRSTTLRGATILILSVTTWPNSSPNQVSNLLVPIVHWVSQSYIETWGISFSIHKTYGYYQEYQLHDLLGESDGLRWPNGTLETINSSHDASSSWVVVQMVSKW